MEALINGGPECAPDGGRNQLNQFVKHLEGRDDGVFQDQFHRDALMQHAGPSSRPTRLAEFNENQFVEEFNNFNVGGPGPMQESFRFREMKSELEHMMDRQAPPMAMGAGDWANEFGQFQQQPQMLRGGNDAEFEAAFRAASSKDWGHEFVMQQQGPHVQALDAEFDRLEQAFSIAKIADPLEAAWTEQFSRVSESLDVKGKGKVVDDSEFAQWDSEFSKIKDTLEANGEISPEMLDKFNSVWKNLAEKDGDYIDPASHSWASEYEDFNTTGSVIDPDPVTAPLAPYEFEENNPFLAHGDPMAEGLRIVKEGGNLSTAALAFEAAAQRDPQNSDAWMHLGRVQAENEKEGPAIAALQRSVQENPTNLPALLALAISYTNESQELQSYATLERWINAKYPSVLNSHPPPVSGTISTPAELHSRTTDRFLEAVRLGPGAAAVQSPAGMREIDPEVQEGLGVLFYMRGEFEKAIDCFSSALGAAPDNYLLWNRLGATLANSGKSEDAIDAYYKAVELKPSFVRCRYNLGVSCINMGCYREAAEHFLGALSLHDLGDGSNITQKNVSDNLWETLRRTFLQLNRADLADLTLGERNLEKFRKDFEF